MTKQLPRGVRNNNPGNIEDDGKTPWQGLALPRSDGRFLRFVSAPFGVRALARTLIVYQDKRRAPDGSAIDTVREIINRWAPPVENDTRAYVAHVAARVGVGPDDPVDMHHQAVLKPLVCAIIAHENAGHAYPDAVIDEGLRLAGVQPPAPSAAKDPRVIGAGIVAAATTAQQAVAQAEGIWSSLQRMGVSPHYVMAVLGLAAVAAGGWFLWDRFRRSRQGIA